MILPKFQTNIKEVRSFEEAVELTGNGKFHYLVLLATGAALLGVIIEGLNMAFVLPLAKCELNLSNAEQGAINAVTFVGVVLTSHFWGFMADTWGRRKVLLLSLGSGFIFSAISSFSVSSTMLLITRFLVGLTISGVMASSISYLGEFHCNRNRSRYVTFAAMFMTVSVIYQALMGLFVMPIDWQMSVFGMNYRTWRLFILFSSMINALAFVIIAFLPESPKFVLTMGRPEEALEILKTVYRINKGNPKNTFPVYEIAMESIGSNLSDVRGMKGMLKMLWKQTKPLLQQPHLGNLLMMCFLTFALFAVSHGFYMWFPQILSLYYSNKDISITTCTAVDMGFRSMIMIANLEPYNNLNGTETEAVVTCSVSAEPMTYYIIIIMGTVFASLYSFVALNSKKLGMKYLLSIWLLISAISTLSLYWTSSFYLNVALQIAMMTAGNCGSILSAVAADLFPTNFKGMALCFVMMFGRIGGVAGSNFLGAVINGYCGAIFIVAAIVLVVAAGVCYYILQKTEEFKK